MADVDALAEIVLAHQERAVVRVGDVFVKVDVDVDRLAGEVAALRSCPVPAPAVLWHQPGPPAIVAMSTIPGRALARHGAPSPFGADTWRAAGRIARRIHDAAPPAGLRTWFVAGGLPHWIESMRTWLLEDGRVDTDVIERRSAHAHRHLDARAPQPVLTHGDLQCEHVLVADDGSITGVIDWGDAGLGDRAYDLASLTVGNAEWVDDVLAGYGAEPSVSREVIEAYWSLRRLGSVRWMSEHGYDPTDDIWALSLEVPR